MNDLYKPRPERWFRFSRRAMLVLVLLTAIPMGWVAAQLQWIRERQEARRWITAHGGDIATERRADFMQQRAPWSIAIFGEQGIAHIGLAARDRGRFHELTVLFPEADYALSPRWGGPSAVP